MPGSLGIADVRRLWPEVLDRVKDLRRFTWAMLSQNAQVVSLDGDTLTLALVNAGARDSFVGSGSDDVVKRALHDVLGVTWRVDPVVDPSVDPSADAASAPPKPKAAPPRNASADSVRAAMRDTPAAAPEDPDASAHPDDPVVDSGADDPEDLLTRELGAQVIDDRSGD